MTFATKCENAGKKSRLTDIVVAMVYINFTLCLSDSMTERLNSHAFGTAAASPTDCRHRLSQHLKLSLRILQMTATELNEFYPRAIRKQSLPGSGTVCRMAEKAERQAVYKRQHSGSSPEDRQNIPTPLFESPENAVLHQLRLNGAHGAIANYPCRKPGRARLPQNRHPGGGRSFARAAR